MEIGVSKSYAGGKHLSTFVWNSCKFCSHTILIQDPEEKVCVLF